MTDRFRESDDDYQARIAGGKPDPRPHINTITGPMMEIDDDLHQLRMTFLKHTNIEGLEGVIVSADIYGWLKQILSAQERYAGPVNTDGGFMVMSIGRTPIYTRPQLEQMAWERGRIHGQQEAMKIVEEELKRKPSKAGVSVGTVSGRMTGMMSAADRKAAADRRRMVMELGKTSIMLLGEDKPITIDEARAEMGLAPLSKPVKHDYQLTTPPDDGEDTESVIKRAMKWMGMKE